MIITSFFKNRACLLTLTLLIIFCISILTRLSFYLDPKNVDYLMAVGLGGDNDYDEMIKVSMRFLTHNDEVTTFFSLWADHPVLTRLFGFFINNFTLLPGLNYLIYFLIFTLSLVSLLPFLLLSRNKHFSVGGLIASLLIAVNPLFISLPSTRAVDGVTTFFYSIFIFLFILALEKRNYLIAVLLGFVGFLDGFNRIIMIVNNPVALFLFGIIYYVTKTGLKSEFPFVQYKPKYILYSFLPFIAFLVFYLSWELYFFMRFDTTWNIFTWSGSSPNHYAWFTGQSYNPYLDKLLNYIILFALSILNISRILNIPLFFITLILISLTMYLKKINVRNFLLSSVFPLILLLIIVSLQYINIEKPDLKFSQLSILLKNLTPKEYLSIFIYLELFIIQFFLLRKEFIKYAALVFTYILMLIYGYLQTFSDRHFVQVMIPLFILLGLSIDKLLFEFFSQYRINYIISHKIKINSDKKNVANRLTMISNNYNKYFSSTFLSIVTLGIFFYVITPKIASSITELFSSINYINNETSYLTLAGKRIPDNGIILAGLGENVMLISKYTKKTVTYNIALPSPYLIPYQKKDFRISYTNSIRFLPKIHVKDVKSSDFNFNRIIENREEFNKYNFFILDYNIKGWEKFLTVKGEHAYLPINTYQLEEFKKLGNRKIYKLILKR